MRELSPQDHATVMRDVEEHTSRQLQNLSIQRHWRTDQNCLLSDSNHPEAQQRQETGFEIFTNGRFGVLS
jgi:hypothetical protein